MKACSSSSSKAKRDNPPFPSIPSFILKFAGLFNSMARDTAADLGINYKMSSDNAYKVLYWKANYSVEETIIATGKSIIEKNIF